jgi:hypothetical protein
MMVSRIDLKFGRVLFPFDDDDDDDVVGVGGFVRFAADFDPVFFAVNFFSKSTFGCCS